MAISLTTVGALLDNDHRLAAYCHARDCGHHGWIDLVMLERQRGSAFRTMFSDLRPLLRCSACGAREATVSLHPPTGTPAERAALRSPRRHA